MNIGNAIDVAVWFQDAVWVVVYWKGCCWGQWYRIECVETAVFQLLLSKLFGIAIGLGGWIEWRNTSRRAGDRIGSFFSWCWEREEEWGVIQDAFLVAGYSDWRAGGAFFLVGEGVVRGGSNIAIARRSCFLLFFISTVVLSLKFNAKIRNFFSKKI